MAGNHMDKNFPMFDLISRINAGEEGAAIAKAKGISRRTIYNKFHRFRKYRAQTMPTTPRGEGQIRQMLYNLFVEFPDYSGLADRTIKLITGIRGVAYYLRPLVKDGSLKVELMRSMSGKPMYFYTRPDLGIKVSLAMSAPVHALAPTVSATPIEIDKEKVGAEAQGIDYEYLWEQARLLHRGQLGLTGYANYVLHHLPQFKAMPEYLFLKAKGKWMRCYPGVPCPFDTDEMAGDGGSSEEVDQPLKELAPSVKDMLELNDNWDEERIAKIEGRFEELNIQYNELLEVLVEGRERHNTYLEALRKAFVGLDQV